MTSANLNGSQNPLLFRTLKPWKLRESERCFAQVSLDRQDESSHMVWKSSGTTSKLNEKQRMLNTQNRFWLKPWLMCKSNKKRMAIGPTWMAMYSIQNILSNTTGYQEVLLAAVAVGVGATFSAPVGGVLCLDRDVVVWWSFCSGNLCVYVFFWQCLLFLFPFGIDSSLPTASTCKVRLGADDAQALRHLLLLRLLLCLDLRHLRCSENSGETLKEWEKKKCCSGESGMLEWVFFFLNLSESSVLFGCLHIFKWLWSERSSTFTTVLDVWGLHVFEYALLWEWPIEASL